MSIAKSLRGADIRVFINGNIYAPVVSFRWSASTGREAIHGIDQAEAQELAPGASSIKGTFEVVRIRASGGLEGAGIAAPERRILQEKYFSLTIIDRVTDTVVLHIDEAALTDQNWQTASKNITTGSFSFEGLGWSNEVDL